MIRKKNWIKASVSLLAAFGSAFVVACADDNGDIGINIPMSNTASTCEALNNCGSSANVPVPQGNSSSSSEAGSINWSHGIDTTKVIIGTDTLWFYDTIPLPPDTSVKWVGESALRITEIAPLNLDFFD